jgi:signal transduction histidine kinase
VLETARSANPELLGNAADAARRLSRLSLDGGPRWVYTLDAQAQFRLLRSEIELVCPLGDEGSHGTLLLGPRRGWLYDGSIVEALGVFARQAGLALENFGLARAQAHAEKLAALGEAAARIAHEIRNPLSSARSLVQLAAHENGVGPLAETAITELDRISRLVGDLVSFARRDEQMALTDVDLAGVCRDALAQVTPLAAEAGAAIEASLEPVRIRGNADRLVQVVANLCRNGIEALGEGHEPERPRLVRIRCGEAERFAEVSVEDYGAGISPEELELIFEPFRTTKRAGTGLGLSIAQRIVRAHGGELLAESRVGEGTTFRVRFPRSTAGAS